MKQLLKNLITKAENNKELHSKSWYLVDLPQLPRET